MASEDALVAAKEEIKELRAFIEQVQSAALKLLVVAGTEKKTKTVLLTDGDSVIRAQWPQREGFKTIVRGDQMWIHPMSHQIVERAEKVRYGTIAEIKNIDGDTAEIDLRGERVAIFAAGLKAKIGDSVILDKGETIAVEVLPKK